MNPPPLASGEPCSAPCSPGAAKCHSPPAFAPPGSKGCLSRCSANMEPIAWASGGHPACKQGPRVHRLRSLAPVHLHTLPPAGREQPSGKATYCHLGLMATTLARPTRLSNLSDPRPSETAASGNKASRCLRAVTTPLERLCCLNHCCRNKLKHSFYNPRD